MTNHSTEIPPAAKAAADRGELIEAMKLTRQATSLGLKEAKDAVDAYLHGATPSIGARNGQVPLQAVSALHQGNLIDAIKRTREATGLGLKESKETVERYLTAHPSTNEQFRTARRGGSGPTLLLVVAGLIVAVAAVFWWFSRT